MSGKSSFARKIVAALLALVLLVSLLPLSVSTVAASDEPETTVSGTNEPEAVGLDDPESTTEPATNDPEGETNPPDSTQPETTVQPEGETQPETTVPASEPEEHVEPELMVEGTFFNDDVKKYVDESTDVLYIAGATLKSISFNFIPDASVIEAFSNDPDAVKVFLKKGDDDAEDITGKCEISVIDNGFNIFLLNKDKNLFENNVFPAGEYKLYAVDSDEDELESTEFTVPEAPKAVELAYEGETNGYGKDSVTVSFKTDSPIINEVMVDGATVSEKDGVYSFAATKAEKYKIKMQDMVEQNGETETKEIKLDTAPPVFNKNSAAFTEADDPEKAIGKIDKDGFFGTEWTNKSVKVSVPISDNGCGVKEDTISVKDKDGADVVNSYTEGVLSFTAENAGKYTVSCSDKLDNNGTLEIEIQIDKDEPKPEDFTLSFASAETEADKILSFITFGIYCNSDILVSVDVNSAEGSPIDETALFNGTGDEAEAIEKNSDGKYVLKAPAEGSKSFDLYAKATDKAGNTKTYSLKNDKLGTKVIDISDEEFQDFDENLFEVVLSNLVPQFDEVSLNFDKKQTVGDPAVLHVAGDGVISVNVKEESTGLQKVYAILKADGAESGSTFAEKDLTQKATGDEAVKLEKVTQHNISFNLKDFADLTNTKVEELGGLYTVEFFATANNRKQNQSEPVSFFVDNAAPALTEPGFQYSKDWTNGDVTVSFALTDSTEISSVVCKDADENEIEVNATDTGYEFVVEKNGTYTVTATDTLGNSFSYDGVVVGNIDKTPPQVKNGAFTFSNNNNQDWAQAVDISFTVEDQPAGECAGLTNSPVTVTYTDVRSNEQTLTEGVSFNLETGVCTFTAKEYGYYSVVLTDAVGNVSEKINIGEIKVDHCAPTITNVDFSMADVTPESTATMNQKPYGTFANTTLKMTVTVENTAENKDNPENRSGLTNEAVKVAYATDEGGIISPLQPNDEKTEFVFTIAEAGSLTADNLKTLKLSVEDIAANKSNYVLGENCQITVEKENMPENIYEVIVSTLPPGIEEFSYSYDESGKKAEGENLFKSQSVTVKSKVSDNIIGLDKIKVECGTIALKDGTDEATLKSVALTDITAQVVTLDSSTEKKTSADVEFAVDTKETARYVFRITATNNAGNTFVKAEYFDVDNTEPEITDIEIHGKVINSGANGIYLKGDTAAYIRVYARDTDGTIPAYGVDNIKLSCGEASELKTDAKGTYVDFTLNPSEKYENITATATDKFGSENKIDLVNFEKGVTGDATVTPNKENFEIVVNNDSSKLEKTKDFTFDFDYNDGDSGIDKIKVYKDVEKGTISFTITNAFSGINSVEVLTLNENSISAKTVITDSEDKYKKVTQKDFVFDAKGYDTGKYALLVRVKDYCDVEKEFSVEYYIDKTAPELVDVKLEPTQTGLDKFFNILTFGLYSNVNVQATVTARDYSPAAGIESKGIDLSARGKVEAVADGFVEKKLEDGTNYREFTKKFNFIVGDSELNSFFNKFEVQVTDKFDNTLGSSAVPENNIKVPISGEGNYEDFVDSFEIVVSAEKPIISNLKTTGENEYTKDNKVWYSAPPVVTFDVTDTISKLQSVKVELNGENVTNLCSINGANSFPERPGVFTDFDNHNAANENNISAVSVTLDTSINPIVSYLLKNSEKDKNGKEGNTISVTATGNNGVSATDLITFYLDQTNPYITGFEFDGEGFIEGTQKPLDTNVVATTYGYYFKNTTTVTVTAADGVDTAMGSGVNRIVFFTKDVNGTITEYKEVATSKSADFVVPANFKGNIFAYAVDNVENNKDKEDQYSPENVIVETQEQHDKFSEISITAPPTPFTVDNPSLSADDRNLYDADTVTLSVETASTYAGIKTVQVDVTAPYDTGKNQSYIVEVPNKGEEENNNGINNPDWYALTKDANLVTKMRGVVRVSNNSNDIKITITLTDRVGFSSKKERIIHIDKVNPTVDVKYDLNNPAQVGGEDFYKETRTATITVTERNFDENAVRATITTNHGTNPPALSAWTHNMNSENPDLSTHVATVVYSADEDYTFGFECTDRAGRKSNTWGPDKFTIDKTLPEISVSFDITTSYEPYHNVTRVATITINEHNFYEPYVQINQTATGADNTTPATPPAVSGWSTSGDTSTATITFDEDGKYSFTVDFKDKADNQARQAVVDTFYIDKHIDKPVISRVQNSHAYADEIAPEIRYFDYNYDKSEYVLTRYDLEKAGQKVTDLAVSDGAGESENRVVSYASFEKLPENDGIYRLEATMQDLAGNKSSDQVLFSVNRFGSTFMLADEPSETLVHEQFYTNDAPDISVREVNVTEIKKSDIQISRDGTTSTLTYGSDYDTTVDGSQNEWYTLVYKIFKKNFAAEGKYDITISATDGFDKTVTNRTAYKEAGEGADKIDRTCPVSFVVDKTAPIITVSGIDNNEYYEEAVREVTVICEDPNITPENLKVTFDKKTLGVADYEMTENAGAIELKLKLEADGNTEDRQFNVSITDKANNPSESEVNPFRLSASWLARLLHYHLPLVIIIGAVVLLGIAFAVFMAVRKNKKNDSE